MTDYLEACVKHADGQGLGEPALMLGAAIPPIPFGLDQTGGMTMCINVTPEVDPDFRWIWVTADDFFEVGPHESPRPSTFMVGLYDGSDESEGGECVEHVTCELKDLIETVREFRRKPRRQPSLPALVRALDINHDMLKDAVAHLMEDPAHGSPVPNWHQFATAKVGELGALVALISKEVLPEHAD